MILDNHKPSDKMSNIEISIQKKQEVEKFIFKGVLKPKLNQRVFKIDLDSGEVSEVEFFKKTDIVNYLDVINKSESLKERNIIVKEGFDYVIKLNIKNAITHFKKSFQHINVNISESHTGNDLLKNQKNVNKFNNK